MNIVSTKLLVKPNNLVLRINCSYTSTRIRYILFAMGIKSVILKLVHPLANAVGGRWIWSRGRRYWVYVKLDPVKVAWIIRQKENGARNSVIAGTMKVSVRR